MCLERILYGQYPEGREFVFYYGGKPGRGFYINNKPWWALTDVCNLIDLGNPSRAAVRLDDDEKMTLTLSNVIKLTNKFQKKEKKPLTKAKKCAARP